MDLIVLALRITSASLGLVDNGLTEASWWLNKAAVAVGDVTDRIDTWADSRDAPLRDGYAQFDERLINQSPLTKARAMLDDPDGYWDRVRRERSQEGRS